MARPSKPISMVQRGIRKKDREFREKQEKSFMTGSPLYPSEEVQSDPKALNLFNTLKERMESIGKDDCIGNEVFCESCLILSEIATLNRDLRKAKDRDEYIKINKMLMEKRNMMIVFARENLLTFASALRAIPKKAPEEEQTEMAKFLASRKG